MAVRNTQDFTFVATSGSRVRSTQDFTQVLTQDEVNVRVTQDVLFMFLTSASEDPNIPTSGLYGQLWPHTSTQTGVVTTVPFILMWNADSIINPVPSGTIELDTRLRKIVRTVGVQSARLVANVVSSSALPVTTYFDVQYSSGSNWISLNVQLPVGTNGLNTGSWASVAIAVAETPMRVVTIGNGGSVVVSSLELQLRG